MNKESVSIKVNVLGAWHGVKVKIPDTIGDQDYPQNRMKVTKYSFYNPYDFTDDYYMNVDLKELVVLVVLWPELKA